jgi:chromosome segregation ATPase
MPLSRHVVPNPDPTVRTVEQLQREIAASREIIETRIAGMDKAIELLQRQTDRFPDHVRGVVEQLQRLHEEKFASIETQFIERDTRTEQTSRDSKVAVDAALQAAKEAVGEQNKSNALAIAKSEAAFTKQIDQIGVLLTTTSNNTDAKIDDLKARIQAMESIKKGGVEIWAVLFGVVGLLLTAGLLASAVFLGTHRS